MILVAGRHFHRAKKMLHCIPNLLEHLRLPIRVAIAGLGTVGRTVARKLADGLPSLTLSAIATRDHDKARSWLDRERIACPLVALDELPEVADLAVECAPAAILDQICTPMLGAGKRVLVLSASAVLPRIDLVELARANGGQIMVPTGALIGFDAVLAAAEGTIHSVQVTTRKPPKGLAGAPYLMKNAISMDNLIAARCVFKGSAREAAAAFPANVNVVAALSLAGIGPDRTAVEVWADPTITRNCHQIRVVADSANFTMSIENVPSDNPKTGRITALSVIAALRKLNAPLVVGT
jgi:aspartate dehydrogenase